MIHQVSNTQAQFILAHPTLIRTAVAAAKGAQLPDGRVFAFSAEPNATIEGCRDWTDFLPSISESDAYTFPNLSEQEAITTTAMVNYSSGTTGLPKGVEVSHHNLIANLEQTIFMRYLNKPWTASTIDGQVACEIRPLYRKYRFPNNITLKSA